MHLFSSQLPHVRHEATGRHQLFLDLRRLNVFNFQILICKNYRSVFITFIASCSSESTATHTAKTFACDCRQLCHFLNMGCYYRNSVEREKKRFKQINNYSLSILLFCQEIFLVGNVCSKLSSLVIYFANECVAEIIQHNSVDYLRLFLITIGVTWLIIKVPMK